eukprot:TRINITY_DN10910_c1_g1_i1.p1 TRINITY_DN10910_c1_g1~~TRINITY_DN10910_c1_g1_i1.p1  ORF type:complete len:1095 (+),score=213.83 TRINITY_DN10910_c1_g1_i1:132-3416(+)
MMRGELEAAGDSVMHNLAMEASLQRKGRSIRVRKGHTSVSRSRSMISPRRSTTTFQQSAVANESMFSLGEAPGSVQQAVARQGSGRSFVSTSSPAMAGSSPHIPGVLTTSFDADATVAVAAEQGSPASGPPLACSSPRLTGELSPVSAPPLTGSLSPRHTVSMMSMRSTREHRLQSLASRRGSAVSVAHSVISPTQSAAMTCRAKCTNCLARIPFGGCATLEGSACCVLSILLVGALIAASVFTGHAMNHWPDDVRSKQTWIFALVLGLWALVVLLIVLLVALFVLSSEIQVDLSDYHPITLEEAPAAPPPPLRGHLKAKGGRWLKDSEGRVIMPRGVNFAAGSKMPRHPNGATHITSSLHEEKVSFVGRPVPLDEADEHLARLRAWGFTFLRLLVTWEAVEHKGPWEYDEEYLEYLKKFVRKAGEYDICVFIDPHQDCWSRWTGGDGAPRWTLEYAGFNVKNLDASGAAMTHQAHGDPFPKMAWVSNYSRLACCTMFTLFWAGDTFAPNLPATPDGTSIQECLQTHFVAAMAKVAGALRDEPNVVGFETLNEPSPGWAGREADLDDWGLPPIGFMSGPRLTPLDAMSAGCGRTIECDVWAEPLRYDKRININPRGVCAWKDGPEGCIWRRQGVWRPGECCDDLPVLLRPDHFRRADDGEPYDFMGEFFAPFLARYREGVRRQMPDALILVESPIWLEFDGEVRPPVGLTEAACDGLVWAPHYYDGITLLTKNFRRWCTIDERHRPVFGHRTNITDSFARVVESHRSHADDIGPTGVPSLVGETGVPMDLADKAAYVDGNFSKQCIAIDSVLSAVEKIHLPFTLWCYAQENDNEHGDLWNGEDFSIWSAAQRTDETDLNSGGRALPALVRPYALRVAGVPQRTCFDPFTSERTWSFIFESEGWQASGPTVVFVPQYQYMEEGRLKVTVSDGEWKLDWGSQTLLWWHDAAKPRHQLTLQRTKHKHRESSGHSSAGSATSVVVRPQSGTVTHPQLPSLHLPSQSPESELETPRPAESPSSPFDVQDRARYDAHVFADGPHPGPGNATMSSIPVAPPPTHAPTTARSSEMAAMTVQTADGSQTPPYTAASADARLPY